MSSAKYRVDPGGGGGGGSMRDQTTRVGAPTGPMSFAPTPRGEASLSSTPSTSSSFSHGASAHPAHGPSSASQLPPRSSKIGVVSPVKASVGDGGMPEFIDKDLQEQHVVPAARPPPRAKRPQYSAPAFPQETPRYLQEPQKTREPTAVQQQQQQRVETTNSPSKMPPSSFPRASAPAAAGDGDDACAVPEAHLRKVRAGGLLTKLPFNSNAKPKIRFFRVNPSGVELQW